MPSSPGDAAITATKMPQGYLITHGPGTIQVKQQVKINILGRTAFTALPSPLENPDDRAVSIAKVREGLLFGARST